MAEFYHECQSNVGQGRLLELPLDPLKTPYDETPRYFENYYCKHCGTRMLRLVPGE